MARQKSDFRQGNGGLAFKDGKLYDFTDRHVLVMRVFPRPMAWLKRRSHGFRSDWKSANRFLRGHLFAAGSPLRPELEGGYEAFLEWLGPDAPPMRRERFEEYRASVARAARTLSLAFDAIPGDVRAEVLRYGDCRWQILSLLTCCPGALDLSRGNPGLTMALAANRLFHRPGVKQPMRAARGLVRRKQRVVLEWLGFPPTGSARRALAKIDPLRVDTRDLCRLRVALRDPIVMKRLSHLPLINEDVVCAVSYQRFRSHAGDGLLRELALRPKPDRRELSFLTLAMHTVEMADAARRVLPIFTSVEHLRHAHDTLAADPSWPRRPIHEYPEFPEPPFAGTAVVEPIRTPLELYEEGCEQQHCCFLYVRRIAAAQSYFYRVLAPVRATLELACVHGHWQLRDMRGRRNAPLPVTVRADAMRQLLTPSPRREHVDPRQLVLL